MVIYDDFVKCFPVSFVDLFELSFDSVGTLVNAKHKDLPKGFPGRTSPPII